MHLFVFGYFWLLILTVIFCIITQYANDVDVSHFFNMKIINNNVKLPSTWYSKATGLTMNFHSLAPIKYKRSVVSRMIY